MKSRILFVPIALGAALALGACGSSATSSSASNAQETSSQTSAAESSSTTQMANPYKEAKTLDELAQIAGFELNFPQSIEGFGEPGYMSAIPKVLAQVSYGSGEPSVLVRKGPSDGKGDISGKYVAYEKETTVDVNGMQVKISGMDEGYLNAIWSKDGYDYSVTPSGFLSEEDFVAIISQVS